MSDVTDIDPQALIGDTVYNPGSVKPLKESDCAVPIPKPNFFIVGGAKCGSTTLSSVLLHHPDCCHSVPKETNFFTMNFDQGWDWYRGAFAHYRGEPLIGEGSVSYASIPFLENVVERLHECNPEAKIIYIVRNPYEKLVSGWRMATYGPGYLAHQSAMKGFEQYVLHEEPKHPNGGPWSDPIHGWEAARPSSESKTRIWLNALHFGGQMDNFRRLFSDDQIKIMFLEDWKANPKAEAASLCKFLGLDPERLPTQEATGVNRADERRQVRGLAKFIGDSKALAPLRHLFPEAIRRPLRKALFRSRLGSRKQVYPDFVVSDEFKCRLIQYLQDVSKDFLISQGKPETFWRYDV